MNGPNAAGVPSDSDSVGGTVPETLCSGPIRTRCVLVAERLPLMSTANHLMSWTPMRLIVSTSPMLRARWLLYVGDASVGSEPSVV